MPRLSRAASHDQPDPHLDAEHVPVASDVLEALGTTTHAIFRFASTRIADFNVPEKLTGPRLRVLFAVKEAGSVRMGDLATQLGVAPRTVTDLVDGLEREGLLVRRPDPTDRRAILLELSASVRERWDQMHALQHEIGEEVLAPLDGAERRQLLDLLNRIKAGAIREVAARPCWQDHAHASPPVDCEGHHPPMP